jgi:uncharacterized membrane protein YdjX (TVP38/TMEM64 family)
MGKKILPFVPFALILVLILVFYIVEGFHFFSFEMIHEESLKWKTFVLEKPIMSALYFIGIYIASVVLVIPDSTFLTLLGGFLFPMPLAVTYACLSETIGAGLFFWAVKFFSSETLKKQHKHSFLKLEKGFHSNQASYLLFFRFSHLMPFWLINVAAGLLRARTSTFLWTTLIGVLPLTFFLVNGAESLSTYFATHTHFTFREIFTTQLKISLIALGCIALLPVLYHRLKKKKFTTEKGRTQRRGKK